MKLDEKITREKITEWISEQAIALDTIARDIGIYSHTLNDFLSEARAVQHKTLVKLHQFIQKKQL